MLELINREVTQEIEVSSDGSDFSIVDAYDAKIKELGLTMGPMCGDLPRALSKKDCYIAKWINIGQKEYPKLDGVVLCEDNRNGTQAVIALF
jgi:hypothetical protein